MVIKRIETISHDIGSAMGCEVEFLVNEITPAVINNSEIASKLENVVLSKDFITNVISNYQTMGSEDFSLYLNEIPGCFFFVGSANEEKGLSYGHHHPKFDFDEKVLPIAVSIMLDLVDSF